MESNRFTSKLVRWVFILHEYDFDIVLKASKVNWDANGLSWNPNYNEEDIIGAKWHG
jgi:hypothetical protein